MEQARSALFGGNKNNGDGLTGVAPFGVSSEDFEEIRHPPLLFLFSTTKISPFYTKEKIAINIATMRSFSFPRGVTEGSGTELKTEIWRNGEPSHFPLNRC